MRSCFCFSECVSEFSIHVHSQPLSSSDPYGLEAWYGGAWNPGNWYRGLMTGSASAPDDVYNAAMEAAGQSYVQNAGNAHAALQMGASIAPPGLSRGFEAVDQVLTGIEGPELQDAIKGNVDPRVDKLRAGVEAGGNLQGLKGGKGLGKLGLKPPQCPKLQIPAGTRNRGPNLESKQGRDFRKDQLELNEFDTNQPSHVRGWLQNERRRISGTGGGPPIPRTPPGYQQAHGRTTPAREGYDYTNSRLQGTDLNRLEERIRRQAGYP